MKTAERTIERPRVERVVETPARRWSAITPIAVLVALALGVLGGYLLRGSGDVDPTAPVTVDGVELTERQEQMLEIHDDYVAAWQDEDGEAAAAMFTENGVLTAFGSRMTADDGGIAGYIGARPAPTLDILEPVLINGNEMLMFHTVDALGTLSDLVTYTTTGEVLIMSHQIMN